MKFLNFEENKEAASLIELHDLIRQGVILSHGIYLRIKQIVGKERKPSGHAQKFPCT